MNLLFCLPITAAYKRNPSSIVHIFNNALNGETTRKIIRRGTYILGRGEEYNGFFYDQLKDQASDASITFIVPALLHMELGPNKTIECCGFLTKKFKSIVPLFF